MEKIPNASPDIGSEAPPSYPGSTAYQTQVIPEPVSYPAKTSTFASDELPPSYPSSSSAISQPKGTSQHTTVPVVTSQPSRVSLSSTISENVNGRADTILALSVCSCITCFIFGSPLTIICFVPAILLAMLVKNVKYVCVYLNIHNYSCCSKTLSLNVGESVRIKWRT